MYARRADSGKFWRKRIAVCVDSNQLPSRSVTESWYLVSCQFVHAIVACRKWPVLSLSTISLLSGWVGGVILGRSSSI